jgi:hypothetical protein
MAPPPRGVMLNRYRTMARACGWGSPGLRFQRAHGAARLVTAFAVNRTVRTGPPKERESLKVVLGAEGSLFVFG